MLRTISNNNICATSGAGTAHLSEHLSSPPVLSGVRLTRSLVVCVCFLHRCLSFCTWLWFLEKLVPKLSLVLMVPELQ